MIKNILVGFIFFSIISATIPQEKIIGKWLFIDDEVCFIFNADSTFEYLAVFDESSVVDTIQFKGKYSLIDSTLTISTEDFESERYKVLKVEKDTMELQYKIQSYILIRVVD